MVELRARSSLAETLGKSTSRCETAVPESVKADMAAHWRLLGYGSEAEYLRDLIMKDLYGSFGRVRSIAQRLVGVIPESTGNFPGRKDKGVDGE